MTSQPRSDGTPTGRAGISASTTSTECWRAEGGLSPGRSPAEGLVSHARVRLEVTQGTVFALLGPNGAGKTTLVRVLATLLEPDAGRAEVFGRDVVKDAVAVREMLGLTGQFAAVDEILSGRENLLMFGRLFGLSKAETRKRADELLAQFELADAADRPARTYSGGMRRRLDLASSLLTRPRILFLDEPTTGLDPRSRNEIWATVRELVRDRKSTRLNSSHVEISYAVFC